MKVALVHYWLVGMRGGEKVLEALCDLYPDADIFTLVADKSSLSKSILSHKITTSFLQRIGGLKNYQKMLPLMPLALESFDLTGYDLVISSEAGPAKGIIPPPDSLHVCYCHSPMRYIWDLYPQYRASAGFIGRFLMSLTAPWLRAWDVTTSMRVDHFIANSSYVAKRIERYYRRQSTVINPPVDVSQYAISEEVEDFYLCAGQITPYKKIELAVEAFTRLGKRLIVVGGGASDALKKIAGPTIEFTGAVDDVKFAHYFGRARALVYPGLEDFGIIPLESLASGRPVIAFAKGGALETVLDGRTGILFEEQTVEHLISAVERMEIEHESFDPEALRRFAMEFERSKFMLRLKNHLDQLIASHRSQGGSGGERAINRPLTPKLAVSDGQFARVM